MSHSVQNNPSVSSLCGYLALSTAVLGAGTFMLTTYVLGILSTEALVGGILLGGAGLYGTLGCSGHLIHKAISKLSKKEIYTPPS